MLVWHGAAGAGCGRNSERTLGLNTTFAAQRPAPSRVGSPAAPRRASALSAKKELFNLRANLAIPTARE